jgi:hypothetical protein
VVQLLTVGENCDLRVGHEYSGDLFGGSPKNQLGYHVGDRIVYLVPWSWIFPSLGHQRYMVHSLILILSMWLGGAEMAHIGPHIDFSPPGIKRKKLNSPTINMPTWGSRF